MAKRERAAPVVLDDGFTINGCAFHVDSKYQPLEAIGQGSYGVVCSVVNAETDEKLAIKKITPMAGDEWDATHTLREIRLMRCLGAHENIIALKDLSMCQEKDELYMMMELADTDLHRLIQSSCPLTEGHIRVIMFQLLSGVKAMHDNGVLHRDLKPGNLLLNKECELKITDFGLARMMPKEHQSNDDGSGDAPASASSVVSPMTEYVVTRWYRPPELMLAPNGCYDGAVDMWSVGCIFGELIARKPMFPGTDFMDQLTRVFKVIPIPDKDARGYFIEKDALKFLSSLPPAPPNALEKFAKSAGAHASDLIQRLLCFNPKQRMSADEALAHPFFHGVKDEWGEIAPLKLDHSLEFAFETQALPLATLRQYICNEVLAFREKEREQRVVTKKSAETEPEAPALDSIESSGSAQQQHAGHAASRTSNNHPIKLENDCAAGKGFTIKGCEFNVPPQYKALQVLGEGSYGIVCAASDATTKKNVAIKKITPMAGDEWDAKHTLREIRLMRYFGQHPNIASLQNLSTCAEKDELYIMMDLVDTDLHRLIQSKTKLEDAHIAAIMYQLLCGAKTLHENGVLHRDLKPGNILVSKNCDVKITDFGLSRYIPRASGDGADKRASHAAPDKSKSALMTEYVVTRWYRPPEIMLAPNGCYNESVDMWSIGCIFGELLNRRPLFPGTDFIDQLTKVFSVLPVPATEDKRGYAVDGDALKFLESLPPCSPSAMTKTFRKAAPEAVSLLRRLLCINPERRITAKQALAHPYFKAIRQQLGEPPEFQVAKAFDFDFDNHELPLSRLKQLIQDEVKLLQKDRLDPSAAASAPIVSAASTSDARKAQANDTKSVRTESASAATASKRDEMSPTTQPGSDSLSDDDDDDFDRAMLRSSLDAPKAVAGPPIAPKEFLAAQHSPTASMTSASSVSSVAPSTVPAAAAAARGSESKQQTQPHKERDQVPETDDGYSDSEVESVKRSHARSKPQEQQQQPSLDSDDEQQEIIHVERSRRSTSTTAAAAGSANATAASKLERPKSATGSHRTAASSARDARDEDHPRQSSSRASNNSHTATSSASHEAERWGQPRATTSRLHHPVYGATMSTATDKRAKAAGTTSRSATMSSSRSASNQHSARESSEKSDTTRHAERVSITTSTSRSHTTSKTTPTSSKTTPTSSRTTASSSSSSSKDAALPDGWIRKTHSKSGREYYYDTLHKVSSWKHPGTKALDNIFSSTTRTPSSSSSSNNKAATPTSADSITPTSSKIVTAGRRTALSSTAAALPKDWARRTDPKSGRLFYVNLLTNKSFAKLPSSVTAAMARSSDSHASGVALSSSASSLATTGAVAGKKTSELLKKKATVPQSPQFSQMSWQRKRAPCTDE